MNKFHLQIRRENSVRDIQQEFSNLFPYLRIDFFSNKGASKQASAQNQVYCPQSKLSEINGALKDGDFEINEDMTIRELEKALNEKFGLYAQVLRKSGNLWIEPTLTCNLSVRSQNEHGKAISPKNIDPRFFRHVFYGV